MNPKEKKFKIKYIVKYPKTPKKLADTIHGTINKISRSKITNNKAIVINWIFIKTCESPKDSKPHSYKLFLLIFFVFFLVKKEKNKIIKIKSKIKKKKKKKKKKINKNLK